MKHMHNVKPRIMYGGACGRLQGFGTTVSLFIFGYSIIFLVCCMSLCLAFY